MTVPELLARVAGHGYRVELTASGPRLVRAEPGGELPAGLVAELRASRGAVVAYLTPAEECRSCGRAVDGCDRAALEAVNPLCGVRQCPYRRRS